MIGDTEVNSMLAIRQRLNFFSEKGYTNKKGFSQF